MNSLKINYNKIMSDLVIGLFYPSVLGSIMYDTFRFTSFHSITSAQSLPLFALSMAIIVHYCVDYLYTIYFERYNWLAMTLDIFVIGAMHTASVSVDAEHMVLNYNTVIFCFALTYALFIFIDIYTIFSENRFVYIVVFEIVVLFSFLIMYLVPVGVYGLIAVVLASSVGLFVFGPKPYVAVSALG